jgi:hypothetical protein
VVLIAGIISSICTLACNSLVMAETVASPEPGLRVATESWGQDVQQFGEISGLPPDARLVPLGMLSASVLKRYL